MIGGVEIEMPAKDCGMAIEVAARAVWQHWPHAAFEDATTGQRFDQFHEIPFGTLDEIFVYRDAQADDVWDAVGAIPAVHNTMIHILVDEGLLTLVVDQSDNEMQQVAAAVRSALEKTGTLAVRGVNHVA